MIASQNSHRQKGVSQNSHRQMTQNSHHQMSQNSHRQMRPNSHRRKTGTLLILTSSKRSLPLVTTGEGEGILKTGMVTIMIMIMKRGHPARKTIIMMMNGPGKGLGQAACLIVILETVAATL